MPEVRLPVPVTAMWMLFVPETEAEPWLTSD